MLQFTYNIQNEFTTLDRHWINKREASSLARYLTNGREFPSHSPLSQQHPLKHCKCQKPVSYGIAVSD